MYSETSCTILSTLSIQSKKIPRSRDQHWLRMQLLALVWRMQNQACTSVWLAGSWTPWWVLPYNLDGDPLGVHVIFASWRPYSLMSRSSDDDASYMVEVSSRPAPRHGGSNSMSPGYVRCGDVTKASWTQQDLTTTFCWNQHGLATIRNQFS